MELKQDALLDEISVETSNPLVEEDASLLLVSFRGTSVIPADKPIVSDRLATSDKADDAVARRTKANNISITTKGDFKRFQGTNLDSDTEEEI